MNKITDQERLDLAHEIFDLVYDKCETFREDNVGADLAYLMGAITDKKHPNDSFVDVYTDEDEPKLISILKDNLPDDHRVWEFVRFF